MAELFRRFDALQRDIAALSQTVNQNDERTIESFRALQADWGGTEEEESKRVTRGPVEAARQLTGQDSAPRRPVSAEGAHLQVVAAPGGPPSDGDASDDERGAKGSSRDARSEIPGPLGSGQGAEGNATSQEDRDRGGLCHPQDKALKYFSIQLKGVQVSQAGDTAFPYARDTCHNCLREFPVYSRHEKALIGLCFAKDDTREYQTISGLNPSASREEMWSLLESQLWNLDHQATARNDFFALKMKKGEIPMDFADRIRGAGGAVHEASEELYKQIFREGVPSRVKAMISLVNSQFTLSSLASGLKMAGVTGGGVMTDRELVGQLVDKEGDDEDRVFHPNEMSEFVCKMTESGMVAGPAPGLPVNPRFRETQCYKCNRLGHMARYCCWKESTGTESTRQGGANEPAAGN